MSPNWFVEGKDYYTLTIHVVTRSSSNKILGIHNEALKVSVTSPPVEGEANKAIIKLLSKFFDVSKSEVEIVRGDTSKRKIIKLPKNKSIQAKLLSF